MDTLPLVTLIFALTATGSMVWLIIRAFKTNPGWGFAVLLFSPVSAIVFGVKYWKEEREPFLLYITTSVATLVLCIYLFSVSGGMGLLRLGINFQQANISGNFTNASFSVEEAPVMDGRFQQDTEWTSEQVSGENTGIPNTQEPAEETADIADEPARKKPRQVRYRLTYVPINIADIKKHIGATAKITRKNVGEKEYRITGASPRHIELAQRSSGGQFSFHFKNSDIENIRVLINEPY